MTEQEAQRVVERAEGFYHEAVSYAAGTQASADLYNRAQRNVAMLGKILGKTYAEVLADIEHFKEVKRSDRTGENITPDNEG